MAFTQNAVGVPCGSCLDYCFTDDEYAGLSGDDLENYSVTATVILDGQDIVTLSPKIQGGTFCFSVTDIVLECLFTNCPMGLVTVIDNDASALLQIRLENSLGTIQTTPAERVINAIEDPLSGFLMSAHAGADRKFLSNVEKSYYCEGGQTPYLYAFLEAGNYTVDDGVNGEAFVAAEDGVYAIPVRTDLAVSNTLTVSLTGATTTGEYVFEEVKNFGEDCCCHSFKFLGKKGAFEHLASSCIYEGILEVERKNYCEYVPCNVDPKRGGLKTYYSTAFDVYRAVTFMYDETCELRNWFKEFLYSKEIYFYDECLESYVRIILQDTAYIVYDRSNKQLGIDFTFRYANNYRTL